MESWAATPTVLLLATCLGLALGSGALLTAISWRVQRRAGRELEETRVDHRIILASGSFGPHARARASEVGFFSVLTKPYRLQTLAQRVAAALRGT